MEAEKLRELEAAQAETVRKLASAQRGGERCFIARLRVLCMNISRKGVGIGIGGYSL